MRFKQWMSRIFQGLIFTRTTRWHCVLWDWVLTARTDSRHRKAKLFQILHLISKASLLPHLPCSVCSVAMLCWVTKEDRGPDTKIGSLEKGAARLGEILITAALGGERFHLLSHIDAKEIRSDVAIVQTILIFVQINQLLQILFFLFDIIDPHTQTL